MPLAGLVNPRIEPEICLGLAHAPDGDEVSGVIAWIAHSVEIVQCHHAGWKVTIADCTASNGLHGRLLYKDNAIEGLPLPGLTLDFA